MNKEMIIVSLLLVAMISILGINNNYHYDSKTISGNAVCMNQWICLNSKTQAFQNENCKLVNITPCKNGCSNGRCINTEQKSCSENWICLNPKTEAYRNNNCKILNTKFCRLGCSNGRCIGTEDERCTEQWICTNSTNKGYRDQRCRITNISICAAGCSENQCRLAINNTTNTTNNNATNVTNSTNNNQTNNYSNTTNSTDENNFNNTSQINNTINNSNTQQNSNITNNNTINNSTIQNENNITDTTDTDTIVMDIIYNITNNITTLSNVTIEINESSNRTFSIVVLPDTQFMVQNYSEIYLNQIHWIVNNKNKLNIQAVIHVGDMVNVANNRSQWETFNSGILMVDEINMPILTSLGNHDHPSTLYDQYFPATRYNNTNWWGGNMKNKGNTQDTDNKYILINVSNEEFMLINVDYCPNNEEIAWANTILEQNSEKKAMLSTHAYLDKDAGRNPHGCTNTTYIWEKLIKNHENLQLVFCGHVHSENRRTDTNVAGKNVYQMLADYQQEINGGNGWLRILLFDPDKDTITVTTYSPYLQQIRIGEQSNFVLEYEIK